MSPLSKATSAIILIAFAALGETFEVASVKPSAPGQPGTSTASDAVHGKFAANNMSLRGLILLAWGLREYQLTGGPKWLDSERYDVVARAGIRPEAKGKRDEQQRFRPMVQALLSERFKLSVHREARDGPIYTLVVAKGGPKLEKTKFADRGPSFGSGPKMMNGKCVTVKDISKMLANQVARDVVDQTGLTESYDFRLDWTPDMDSATNAAETGGPSFFTAVQEQLGLRLESGKGPIEILVIDHAEKASEN